MRILLIDDDVELCSLLDELLSQAKRFLRCDTNFSSHSPGPGGEVSYHPVLQPILHWEGVAAVVNAGDGWHEHPTQGLLDALTMLDEFETRDLKGRIITIVGDITHSRVFGSLVRIANKQKR